MIPRRFRVFLTLPVLLGGPALAEDLEVRMAEIPPHMDVGGEGREADIIRAISKACGWTVMFDVEPFTRHWRSFESGDGDAVGTVPIGMTLGGIQTDSYVTYRNGVTMLDATGITPTSLEDLAGLDVVAFAGATDVLPGLLEARAGFSSYREVGDQLSHSRLLFAGRVDAILGDGMITAEYNRRLANGPILAVDASQPTTFSPIFEPTRFAMVFRDPDRAMAFDACLDQSREAIAAINAAYVERYRDAIGEGSY